MKFIKHIVSIVLCGILLLGISHFSISKMTCLGSGKITYGIGQLEDCCGDENTPNTSINPLCCDISSFQINIDLPAFNHKKEVVLERDLLNEIPVATLGFSSFSEAKSFVFLRPPPDFLFCRNLPQYLLLSVLRL
jgi:hypothetical protein